MDPQAMTPADHILKAALNVLNALDVAEASGLISRDLLRAAGELRMATYRVEWDASHDDAHGTTDRRERPRSSPK